MFKFSTRLLFTALAVFGWTATASAATTTTTFGVTATVSDSCSVTASALGFGTIDPTSGTATDATTTIDVTCSNSTTYDIGLDAGTTSGATVTSRQMDDGGGNLLDYALYSDSGRTTNWGDTVGTDTVAGTGDGTAQTHTVYGRVPDQPTALVGSYSDTITVTVTY
jgi:spore coat protein U-like protein